MLHCAQWRNFFHFSNFWSLTVIYYYSKMFASASLISTVFVNAFVFLSVWTGMTMLPNQISIGHEERVVWIFLLAILAELIVEILFKNDKVILPKKSTGMRNNKLRVKRRQTHTSVYAIFALLAIEAYSKFSIQEKPLEINIQPFKLNIQFMVSFEKTGNVMDAATGLDNLVYEPLDMESIPIQFKRLCLPRKGILEPDQLDLQTHEKCKDQSMNISNLIEVEDYRQQSDQHGNVKKIRAPSRISLPNPKLLFNRLNLIRCVKYVLISYAFFNLVFAEFQPPLPPSPTYDAAPAA